MDEKTFRETEAVIDQMMCHAESARQELGMLRESLDKEKAMPKKDRGYIKWLEYMIDCFFAVAEHYDGWVEDFEKDLHTTGNSTN